MPPDGSVLRLGVEGKERAPLAPRPENLLGLRQVFVGADVDMLLLATTPTDHAALSIHGQVGVKF
jgi:hypothetical protein